MPFVVLLAVAGCGDPPTDESPPSNGAREADDDVPFAEHFCGALQCNDPVAATPVTGDGADADRLAPLHDSDAWPDDAGERDPGDDDAALPTDGSADDAPALPSADGPIRAPASWSACAPPIADAVLACTNETIADVFANSDLIGDWLEALRWCTDAEWVIRARDEACATDGAAPAWCAQSVEAFMEEGFAACRRELAHQLYSCSQVLAGPWTQGRQQPGVRLVRKTSVWQIDALSEVQRQQLAIALNAAPGTREEGTDRDTELRWALDELAEFTLLRLDFWDISNRRPLDVWTWTPFGETGTEGVIFVGGGTDVLGTIRDDLVHARGLPWGDEGRACLMDADCTGGIACVGSVAGMFAGQCVHYGHDFEAGEMQAACGGDSDCAAGLLCSDAHPFRDGLCLPAWMRRTIAMAGEAAIPEGEDEPLTVPLMMTGTASVSTDVWLRVGIRHPDITQVRATLTNPDGTEVTVLDGFEYPVRENFYRQLRLDGFPGDEASNGEWLLRVEDAAIDGRTGVLEQAELTVGSRWD